MRSKLGNFDLIAGINDQEFKAVKYLLKVNSDRYEIKLRTGRDWCTDELEDITKAWFYDHEDEKYLCNFKLKLRRPWRNK